MAMASYIYSDSKCYASTFKSKSKIIQKGSLQDQTPESTVVSKMPRQIEGLMLPQ